MPRKSSPEQKSKFPAALRGMGPRLKELREAHHLATSAFKPISHATISRLESEQRMPKATVLLAIANKLRVSLDLLIRGYEWTEKEDTGFGLLVRPEVAESLRAVVRDELQKHGALDRTVGERPASKRQRR